jgi:hypothetical protein
LIVVVKMPSRWTSLFGWPPKSLGDLKKSNTPDRVTPEDIVRDVHVEIIEGAENVDD